MTPSRAESAHRPTRAAAALVGSSQPVNTDKPALTKIIATVGPASSSPEAVRKLIETGVAIFRLNFGHGSLEEHTRQTQNIREVAASLGLPTAVMGDIQGPKIRVGRVAGDGVEVEPGDVVIFQRNEIVGQAGAKPLRLSSTFSRLIDDVEPGERLLVADGAVRMLVIGKRKDEIECTVSAGGGGRISTGKGINLPDTKVKAEVLSDRDWECVEWSLANGLDFLALSFVRDAADVEALRSGVMKFSAMREKDNSATTPATSPIRIIAKIERPEGVQNAEEILDVADGIMIARGDLGVEMDLARVPVIQKQLLAAAKAAGKPCIVATQMLESMIHAPAPTRAEASDVAGAILDGTDAVMLSGETAIGEYPVLAVEYMRRIALSTEDYVRSLPPQSSAPRKLIESRYRTAALAHGAWQIAQDIKAQFIVVWSQQGGGARYLSQNEFNIPIIACTSDDRAARQMQVLRGVTPVRMPVPNGLAHFTQVVDNYLLETGWARPGDACILIAGAPIGTQGVTNSLAIHNIGDQSTGFSPS